MPTEVSQKLAILPTLIFSRHKALGYFDDFLRGHAHDLETIHTFVGRGATRGARPLVVVMALATVIGLGGTLVTEIDYTSTFLLAALDIPIDPDVGGYPYAPNVIHIAVLLFTGFYVLWGGYRAVVLTDAMQVPLSYGSFGIVLFSICGLAVGNQHSFAAGLTALLASLLLAGFLLSRYMLVQNVTTYDLLLFSGLILFGLVVGISALFESRNSTISSLEFLWPHHNSFWGFGLLGVVSLAVANAIWQFVDISSLQRLKSLELTGRTDSDIRKIGRGLLATALEASGVWVLVILLAFALKAVNVHSYPAIPEYLAGLKGPSLLLLPILVFAFTVFMVSTVDGFMSATSFVAFCDLRSAKASQPSCVDTVRTQLRGPRWATVATIVLIYAGYLILKWRVERVAAGRIDLVLYAIYALQSSIFPLVIARMIWPRRVNSLAGILSIVAGAACAVYTAALRTEPWPWVPIDSWYVFPPLATFVSAGLTYTAVAMIASRFRWRFTP